MADFYLEYMTSLSSVYFYNDQDTDRFDEWFGEQLTKAGLFEWRMTDTPKGIAGVAKLSIYVNTFDYKHKVSVGIVVDDDSHDLDELADNVALCRYIERDLAYRILDELNAICESIVIPMNNGTFDDLKFDNEEFYGVLMYNTDYGYYVNPRIKNTQFELYRDFELLI